MDATSLELLSENFDNKLSELQTSLELRDASLDESCLPHFNAVETEISKLQLVNVTVKTLLGQWKEELQKLKKKGTDLEILNARLEHMVENIPQHLPKPNHIEESKLEVRKETMQTMATVNSDFSQADTKPRKQQNVYFPEIQYLTVDEFEGIPKYLKGRLTYDQINKQVDKMNQAYKAKYQLMKQKKSSLSDSNRKRTEAYRAQETKDTAGCYFITEDDMKTLGGITVDKVARSVLTILRQCTRIREVRGGNLTRYVYVNTY